MLRTLCVCVNACVLVRLLSVTTCNMHAIIVFRQLNYIQGMHDLVQSVLHNVMCITCMTRAEYLVPGYTVLL